MTEEELKKVSFQMVSSMSMRESHTLTYSSKDGKLGFAVLTPMRNGRQIPGAKVERAWRIENKWYENYLEFLADLKDFHTAKIIKFEPRRRK